MVKIGLPFLSIFPEEIVLSSLFNKKEYTNLLYNSNESLKLQIHEKNMDKNTAKNNGYYFHHRYYKNSSNNSSNIILDKKYYVSFDTSEGRFGNQLFRYLTCKLFTLYFGHEYICQNNFPKDDYIIVNEDNIELIFKNNDFKDKNILCQGYFQKSELFIKDRKKLIDLVYNNNDYLVSVSP
jgi:hypothetical protein